MGVPAVLGARSPGQGPCSLPTRWGSRVALAVRPQAWTQLAGAVSEQHPEMAVHPFSLLPQRSPRGPETLSLRPQFTQRPGGPPSPHRQPVPPSCPSPDSRHPDRLGGWSWTRLLGASRGWGLSLPGNWQPHSRPSGVGRPGPPSCPPLALATTSGDNVPGMPRRDCHSKAAFSLRLRDDGTVHEGPALRSLVGRPGLSGDGAAVHPDLALGRPPRLMCRGQEP